jgi:hypothetical protein
MPRQAVRTFLEMTDPSALQGAPVAPAHAVLDRVDDCAPALWRGLYTEVGREYHWVDRLAWTDDDITRYLADPALELWVLRVQDETAGYFELRHRMTTARSRWRISGCCRRSPGRGSGGSC